jgi:hypothetical protein
MGHLLPGFLPTYLTGCSGNKPDLPHFRCPLLIVVGFSRRRTKVVLPEMYHFMHKGREHLLRASGRKMRWIQCYFIGDFFLVCGVLEALSGKVAKRPLLALDGNETRRQCASEQLTIEMIVSRSQAGIR